MGKQSLADLLQAYGGPVKLMRNARLRPERLAPYSSAFYPLAPVKPAEFSDWATEQRAWHETAILFDLNHHMVELYISGPDARKLISDLAVNSPGNFTPGRANQMSMCNAEGYSITDGILCCFGENEFNFAGPPIGVEWIRFQAKAGGYDVELTKDDRSPGYPNGKAFNRRHYRFQIQGPNAVQIIEKLTGKPFPQLKFFHTGEIEIAGLKVNALRHGMSGAPGLEIWGPFAEREEIRSAIIATGREFGMHLVGGRAYYTNPMESGWIPTPISAIYSSESTRAFREWLPADSTEALVSIDGSFYSEKIEDYYITPYTLGYEHIIKFDHQFIGSEALKKMERESQRKKVTLAWNGEDVGKVFAAMMQPGGENIKLLDLPVVGRYQLTDRPCDQLLKQGQPVGISFLAGYISTERTILSLAVVDQTIEVGEELVLLWGEAGSHNDVPLSPTKLLEIRATVTPTPYSQYAREKYRK